MSVLGFAKKNKDDVEPRCPILHDHHLLTSASTFAEIQCHLWCKSHFAFSFTTGSRNMSWECRLNKTCILICIQSSAPATSAGAPTDHDDGQLSPWILATHPISFVDGAEKKTWRRVPEMYRFRCFSGFCAEKLEWQTVRMGVSCSKMETGLMRAFGGRWSLRAGRGCCVLLGRMGSPPLTDFL
jgi:hypothetical protein